jgi:Uma2 family endonuclease
LGIIEEDDMSVKVLMDVGEYLHTSFDGPDYEYLDGEVVERNIGELPHGRVQSTLVRLIWQAGRPFGLRVVTEIRIQISPTRYRIPDLSVWLAGDIGTGIPTKPPFLAIEVLSPEDRMTGVQPKIAEYLSIGVDWIWLIDPIEKNAIIFSQTNPVGLLAETLRTEHPAIEISLARALDFNS